MLKIGVTGGIGSGKTTVCKVFESLGIPVYYADAEAKKILSSDPAVKKNVKTLLGDESYFRNGKVNRRFVAKLVFGNRELLNKLNEIVHPAVALHSARWFESLKNDYPYAIKEAALLVETGSYKELNQLIVVTAPENVRIDRVMKRDNIDREEVLNRINNQLSVEQKMALADHIVHNSGERSIVLQVWKIHQKLMKKKINN